MAPDTLSCASPFVRAFIAVEIPATVRHELAVTQKTLRKNGADVAWVNPLNFHISLAFLGNIPRNMVSSVALLLDTVSLGKPPFSIQAAGIGTFGNPLSPRVIWAGTSGDAPLQAIHCELKRELGDLRMTIDDRPFSAHITLGRVKSGDNRQRLVEALSSVRSAVFGEIPVNGLLLMQSVLMPAGAEYTRLHASVLG